MEVREQARGDRGQPRLRLADRRGRRRRAGSGGGARARAEPGVLEANEADYDAASGRLDEGTLDRLRLDAKRIETLAAQVEATAAIEPLEREIGSWTLANGLEVSERRIPIGTVGANFEARPNVALDVAGQLLKSLNAAVLRTGGAALRTVTTLVDDVLRPALEQAGLPPGAVGLVRTPDHEGARASSRCRSESPRHPPRQRRDHGRARSARRGERSALAHAEGGGVLYVHESADRDRLLAIAEASLDRIGVCNRLNLALVDHRAPEGRWRSSRSSRGSDSTSTERPARGAGPTSSRSRPGYTSGRTTRTAPPASRSTSSRASTRPCGLPTRRPRGSPRGSSPRTSRRRGRSSTATGTAAAWNASTRFVDGFELTSAPETGINVGREPGPRGPVTYRDLWLRQYRIVGDGTQKR